MNLEQAKQYIGIDYLDDDAILEEVIIPAATAWVKNAVGWADETNPEWKALLLLLIQDMYDNRCLAETAAANQRKTVRSMIAHLQLKEDEENGETSAGGTD